MRRLTEYGLWTRRPHFSSLISDFSHPERVKTQGGHSCSHALLLTYYVDDAVFYSLEIVPPLPLALHQNVPSCHVKPPCTGGPKRPVRYSSPVSALINNAGAGVSYPRREVVIRRPWRAATVLFTQETSVTATWDGTEAFGADLIYSRRCRIFAERTPGDVRVTGLLNPGIICSSDD